MSPSWVTDLDDYVRWLGEVLDQSGAYPEPDYLLVEETPLTYRPGVGEELGIVIREHRLWFPGSDLVLMFKLYVVQPADLATPPEVLNYNFHLQTEAGECVWRYDKHEGHESEVGGLTHAHLATDPHPVPAPEVDLEQVIALAWEHAARP